MKKKETLRFKKQAVILGFIGDNKVLSSILERITAKGYAVRVYIDAPADFAECIKCVNLLILTQEMFLRYKKKIPRLPKNLKIERV